jgi:hypothetical protein
MESPAANEGSMEHSNNSRSFSIGLKKQSNSTTEASFRSLDDVAMFTEG